MVLRRLIRSLPTRRGVLGVATCDKGLPAMMMALAAMRDLPCVLVPGGVTLPPRDGEDAGKVQTIGARFAHGEITLRAGRRPRLPRLRRRRAAAASSSAPPRPRRWSPRRSGMTLPHSRAGAVRPADLARHGAPLGTRAGRAIAGARPDDARHPDRRRRPQRHGRPRRVRRLDQSAPAHPRHRPRRRPARGRPSTTGARSTAACRASSMCCRTARSAIRPCACSSPAAFPRSCCTCASSACSTRRA